MGCGSSQPTVRNTVLMKTIDNKPYEGEILEYSYYGDIVPVKLTTRTDGHYRHVVDAEQMQELLKEISTKYENKYRLAMLHHIPPPSPSGTTRAKIEQFQAVLYKSSQESDENWTLSVDRVNILSKIIGDAGFDDNAFEVKSDTRHIGDLLNEKSATGARFITAALTGASIFKGYNFSLDGSRPVLQLDFIFEVPSIHNTEFYTYHIESTTVIKKVENCVTGRRLVLICDWVAEFNLHLKKGWKLIEIFPDGSSKRRPSSSGTEVIKNFLWIWEAPFTEEAEPSQQYEGAVIEQTAVTLVEGAKSIFEGKAYWEEEISKLGKEGWELACMIQNPHVERSICNIKFGNIMFFQRKMKSIEK